MNYEDAILEEYARRRTLRAKGRSFLDFITHRASWLVVEEFHVLVAEHFQQLLDGTISRLMIFAPPRAGKSLLTSELLPEWWIGNNPQDQILHTSYATTLVEGFGRRIKNALMTDAFKEVFPTVTLSRDSKSAARWATEQGGIYHAAGVGTGIAGKGFHLGLIDDPISEQDAFSKAMRRSVNDWYGPGFYTRRMPERNVIVLTQTRWATDDLSGFLLSSSALTTRADDWTVLKIPAILDEKTAQSLNRIASTPEYHKYITGAPINTYKAGDSFSPRRWPLSALNQSRGNMPRKQWAALYQQSPTEDEGSIILREHWRKWPSETPPKFEYILQSYDTAFEEEEKNDFSARTTIGIFKRESDSRLCVFIIEAWKARMNFPDLREEAYRSYKEYKPDRVIIEKKASGHSLVQELRKKGVPITPVTPKSSKTVRAHAATVLFEQGVVYYPDRRWAEDLIDDCAVFPNGAHDDTVDSVVHALNFIRRMFLAEAPSDEQDEDDSLPDTPMRSYARLHNSYARGA